MLGCPMAEAGEVRMGWSRFSCASRGSRDASRVEAPPYWVAVSTCMCLPLSRIWWGWRPLSSLQVCCFTGLTHRVIGA